MKNKSAEASKRYRDKLRNSGNIFYRRPMLPKFIEPMDIYLKSLKDLEDMT